MIKIPHLQLPPEAVCTKTMQTAMGTIYFYGKIVIVEFKEGVTVSYKNAFPILVRGLTILGSKPWVYISNRVESYSVKPMDYKYLNKVPTLQGLAIVNYSETAMQNAQLEAVFCEKPFKTFTNLYDAYLWAQLILNK